MMSCCLDCPAIEASSTAMGESVVFDLNKTILAPIVCEWLGLKYFLQLELTISKYLSTVIHGWIQHPAVQRNLCPPGSILSISSEFVQWCQVRNVNPNQILHDGSAVYMRNAVNLLKQKVNLKRIHLIDCEVSDIYGALQTNTDIESLTAVRYEVASVHHSCHSHSFTPLLVQEYSLQSLFLHHCDVNDQVLIAFLIACRHLTCLSSDCLYLDGKFFCALIVWGRNIHTLELLCNSIYNPKCTDMLILHGSSLYKSIRYNMFDNLSIRVFLWYGGSSLRELSLMPKKEFLDYDDELSIIILAVCSSTLTSLNISNCYDINDDGLAPALQRLPLLTYLNIMNLPNITVKTVHTISDCCHELTAILVGGLPYSLSIMAEDVTRILVGCPLLRELSLIDLKTSLDPQPFWSNLTDLDVGGNPDLTDCTFVSIFQVCRKLTAVHLNGCFRATIKSMRCLVEYCPFIKILNIGMCTYLVIKSVIALLLTQCSNLTHLDLYNSKLPPAVLPTIFACGGRLKRLGLYECKPISINLLKALSLKLTRLRVLGISPDLFRYQHIEEMIAANPNLQFEWQLQSTVWQRMI